MGIEGEGRVGLAWPDPAELLPLGHSMDFGFFFLLGAVGKSSEGRTCFRLLIPHMAKQMCMC